MHSKRIHFSRRTTTITHLPKFQNYTKNRTQHNLRLINDAIHRTRPALLKTHHPVKTSRLQIKHQIPQSFTPKRPKILFIIRIKLENHVSMGVDVGSKSGQ